MDRLPLTETSNAKPIKRLVSAIAVALGFTPGGAAIAQAPKSLAPHEAPQAWLDYATLVSDQVNGRIGGDDPVAQRLRGYLAQLPGADQHDGVTLRLSIWVEATGAISRIGFTPFVQQQPNDDLQALVVGITLPKAPPEGMLLPLRLAVQIKPKEPAPPKPLSWTDGVAAPGPGVSRVTYRLSFDAGRGDSSGS